LGDFIPDTPQRNDTQPSCALMHVDSCRDAAQTYVELDALAIFSWQPGHDM
jgi:hypothetical protein